MFVRHSTPSVRYNVHIFERHSILSLLYNICIVWLSQYTITMIQRPCRLYVTLCRHYDTTSAMSVRHSMPSPCFFVFKPSYCTTWVLCYRHSSPSSWYVWGDVTQWVSDSHKFEPHKAPVASLIVLSVPHSMSSLLYNVRIMYTSRYAVTSIQRPHYFNVTVCRHVNTKSALFVRHRMPSR